MVFKNRQSGKLVQAFQWFKRGDHLQVYQNSNGHPVVGRPNGREHIVLSGDWIVTGANGDFAQVIDPDIFMRIYVSVEKP